MSDTSLAKKFGLLGGVWVGLLCPPAGAEALLRLACPEVGRIDPALVEPHYDVILFWPPQLDNLAEALRGLQQRIPSNGAIWAMIPKKKYAQRRGVDFTWEQLQAAGLETDLVDNKVATFDEQDYGTRFVIRKKRRSRMDGDAG